MLIDHGLSDSATSILSCSRNRRCRNRHCIVCIALRAVCERRHLKQQVNRLRGQNPQVALWAVSPKPLDSCLRHRNRAFELVAGIRSLARSLPVTDWFGATEVQPSGLGDSSLNIHGHVMLVLDTPAGGKNYIPVREWEQRLEDTWQEVCPSIAVNSHPVKLGTVGSALSWSSYITKAASLPEFAQRTRAALSNPTLYLAQAEAIRGVSRFFGPMALGSRAPTPNRCLN